jgi:hypothetical protein
MQAAREACTNLQSLRSRDPLAANTEILRRAIGGLQLTPQQWAGVYASQDYFTDPLREANAETVEAARRGPAAPGDISGAMQAIGTHQRERYLRDNDLRNMKPDHVQALARSIQQWADPASPGPRPEGWPLSPQQRQQIQANAQTFANPHFTRSLRPQETEVSVTSLALLGISTPECDMARLQPAQNQTRRPTGQGR